MGFLQNSSYKSWKCGCFLAKSANERNREPSVLPSTIKGIPSKPETEFLKLCGIIFNISGYLDDQTSLVRTAKCRSFRRTSELLQARPGRKLYRPMWHSIFPISSSDYKQSYLLSFPKSENINSQSQGSPNEKDSQGPSLLLDSNKLVPRPF